MSKVLFQIFTQIGRIPNRGTWGVCHVRKLNVTTNHNFTPSKNCGEQVKGLEEANGVSTESNELARKAGVDSTLALELSKLTRSEMHSYVKLMFSFGVGVVGLGLGGGTYKLICHDSARDDKLNTKIDQAVGELRKDSVELKKDFAELKTELKKDVAELKGAVDVVISLMQNRKE